MKKKQKNFFNSKQWDANWLFTNKDMCSNIAVNNSPNIDNCKGNIHIHKANGRTRNNSPLYNTNNPECRFHPDMLHI